MSVPALSLRYPCLDLLFCWGQHVVLLVTTGVWIKNSSFIAVGCVRASVCCVGLDFVFGDVHRALVDLMGDLLNGRISKPVGPSAFKRVQVNALLFPHASSQRGAACLDASV